MEVIGNVGLRFPDNSIQTRAAALQNRNMIVNGAMAVSQEHGEAVASVPVSTPYFLADQWDTAHVTGSGAALDAGIETIGNYKYASVTAVTAATDLSAALQAGRLDTALEAQNVFHLNGKTVTLSFKCLVNWTGNLGIAFNTRSRARSYVTSVPVVSGENDVSVTIDLEAASVVANDNGEGLLIKIGLCNEGTLQTSTENAWQAGDFRTSTIATQWVKTLNNYLKVTNVQLEEGNVATPFEHRKYSDYLAECQRYFYTPDNNASGIGGLASGFAVGSTSAIVNMPLSVPMRDVPSLLPVTANWYAIEQNAGDRSVTNVLSRSESTRTNMSLVATSTALTGGQGCSLRYNNSGAKLKISARL